MMEGFQRDGSAIFAVRVVPRASRNAIEGEHGDALKVRLTRRPSKIVRTARFAAFSLSV